MKNELLLFRTSIPDRNKIDEYLLFINKVISLCNAAMVNYYLTQSGKVELLDMHNFVNLSLASEGIRIPKCLQDGIDDFILNTLAEDEVRITVLNIGPHLKQVVYTDDQFKVDIGDVIELCLDGNDTVRLVFEDLPFGRITSIKMMNSYTLASITYNDIDIIPGKPTVPAKTSINICRKILGLPANE